MSRMVSQGVVDAELSILGGGECGGAAEVC
jgi:hypothetical protein